MYRVALKERASFQEFRGFARRFVASEISPEQIVWSAGATDELFGEELPAADPRGSLTVPSSYVALAEDVICHRNPERFALLYQMLWRIVHGERELPAIAADPLTHRLEQMRKAVGRDKHKMTAFVRFRRVADAEGESFVAWFEPEHHILRAMAEFFTGRFFAMRWSILTPDGTMHWDGHDISFGPGVTRDQAPPEDALDDWWRLYYRATFNPARANPDAMRAEMPKKYWRNLPEAAVIPDLLASAGGNAAAMIAAEPTLPRPAASHYQVEEPPMAETAQTLSQLRKAAAGCQRCPLYRNATQTVFGEGPAHASVMFVGEQPGDQEDLAGKPFVGPAGQLFDRALGEAGIDRRQVYVTNAVKHFKFEPRGKRRIHQKPNAGEIDTCRWWLGREIELVRPSLIVVMGATAARGLTGRPVTISKVRGQVLPFGESSQSLVTVHPSFLLRLPDEAARTHEYGRFVEDLRAVARAVPAVRMAA